MTEEGAKKRYSRSQGRRGLTVRAGTGQKLVNCARLRCSRDGVVDGDVDDAEFKEYFETVFGRVVLQAGERLKEKGGWVAMLTGMNCERKYSEYIVIVRLPCRRDAGSLRRLFSFETSEGVLWKAEVLGLPVMDQLWLSFVRHGAWESARKYGGAVHWFGPGFGRGIRWRVSHGYRGVL